MSALFGGGNQPTTAPDYTGLQIQTAVNTLPIPIVWGESKVAPNVVWYNNFQTQESGGGKSGGKGGLFGGNGGAVSYTYSAAVILALSEGPIEGINQVWKNQSVYTLSGLGLSLFTGTTPQTVWSYLASAYPSQALAYQGSAYVCAPSYSLGDSATLDNHNFEVQGFFFGSGYGPGYATGADADPALIVSDFLTNPQYGIAAPNGFPQASIAATTLFSAPGGGDSSYQTYCRAVGLALSPALTDQEQASSILQRWLQLTNTAAVWSGGMLKFVPYGDSTVTGNGITFNPNVTPIYGLTDDDFKLENNEDPLQVSRSDPYTAYNVWRLEIAERSNAYNLTTVESRDQSAIELYGMRIAPTVTAHEICDPNIALISGQLILQRAVYIRNTYKFRLSWEYCLLDPMDLVTVTDTILGLSNAPIRITEIEEDENGFLQVTAEEFPLGAATATLYATQPVTNNPINRNVAPDPVNPPIIFEPPSALVSPPQVWIAASGGASGVADPNWGGANVWLSTDGTSYAQIGTIVGPATQGVLTAALPAFSGTNPDAADTVSVNMAESVGALASVSGLDAQLAATLCIVDDELFSYATAALTSANNYALTHLYRGLYGSAATAHAIGAQFAFLSNNSIFKYDLPSQYVGQELYFKLQSFNVFGGGIEEISSCATYLYMPTGAAFDHPVAEAILVGGSLDFGAVGSAADVDDDFGSPFTLAVELDVDLGAA